MNYDNKTLSRIIDDAGIATHHVDKGAAYIAEIYRDLLGARRVLQRMGSGATQIVANLSQEPATVISANAETFNIGGTTNTWKGKIDGGSSITVTLSSGTTQTAANIAADFNANSTFNAVATAYATTAGKIALRSNSIGQTSSIQIEAVANDCYTIVGFTEATTTGDAKAWNDFREDLVTAVEDAITEAKSMMDLATNTTGHPELEDITELATE